MFLEEIVEELKDSVSLLNSPLQKGYEAHELVIPYNPVNGKEYNSLNALALLMKSGSQENKDPRWLSESQGINFGGQLLNPSYSQDLLSWKFSEVNAQGERVPLERPLATKTTVYSASSFAGAVLPPIKQPKEASLDEIKSTIYNNGFLIFESEEAFFDLSQNSIYIKSDDNLETKKQLISLYAQGILDNKRNGTVIVDGSKEALYEMIEKEQTITLLGAEFGIGRNQNTSREFAKEARILLDSPNGFGLFVKALNNADKNLKSVRELRSMNPDLEVTLEQERLITQIKSFSEKYNMSVESVLDDGDDNVRLYFAYEDSYKPEPMPFSLEVKPDGSNVVIDANGNEQSTKVSQLIRDHHAGQQKFFIDVPYSLKNEAKELGARWDREAKSWYVKTAEIEKFNHEFELVAKNKGGVTMPTDSLPSKIYLNVMYSDRNEAKELGARWDREAKAWWVDVNNKEAIDRFSERDITQHASEENIQATQEKIYLDVEYEDRQKARSIGAKWDREAKSWYVLDSSHEAISVFKPKAQEAQEAQEVTQNKLSDKKKTIIEGTLTFSSAYHEASKYIPDFISENKALENEYKTIFASQYIDAVLEKNPNIDIGDVEYIEQHSESIIIAKEKTDGIFQKIQSMTDDLTRYVEQMSSIGNTERGLEEYNTLNADKYYQSIMETTNKKLGLGVNSIIDATLDDLESTSTLIYLDIPYKDRKEAREMGAKWDAELTSWYVTSDNTQALNMWETKDLDELKLQAEIDMANRIYLDIPYKDRKEARKMGAKWDKANEGWYVTDPDAEAIQKWERKSFDSVTIDRQDKRASRIYLDVDFDEKDQAKEMGARWDDSDKSWYINFESDNKDALLDKFGKNPAVYKKESTAIDFPEKQQEGKKIYLAVPYENKDNAKELGARWDREAKSWYIEESLYSDKLEKFLPENVQNEQAPAIRPEEEFRNFLISEGFDFQGAEMPVPDGKIHRHPVDGDQGAKKSGYYAFHDNGNGFFGGMCENYKTGRKENWTGKGVQLSQNEMDAIREKIELNRLEAEKAIKEQQEFVASLSKDVLNQLSPMTESKPYFVKKEIKPHKDVYVNGTGSPIEIKLPNKNGDIISQFINEDDVVIPLRNEKNEVVSLQTISPDGNKMFLAGGEKKACFHVIEGQPVTSDDEVVIVTEGYATGATIHESTRLKTVVAFDSGNLESVVKQLQASNPDLKLLIAADDDKHRELENKINVGRSKAEKLQEELKNVRAIFPVFEKYEEMTIEEKKHRTDFNDLACLEDDGANKVNRQIMASIRGLDRPATKANTLDQSVVQERKNIDKMQQTLNSARRSQTGRSR